MYDGYSLAWLFPNSINYIHGLIKIWWIFKFLLSTTMCTGTGVLRAVPFCLKKNPHHINILWLSNVVSNHPNCVPIFSSYSLWINIKPFFYSYTWTKISFNSLNHNKLLGSTHTRPPYYIEMRLYGRSAYAPAVDKATGNWHSNKRYNLASHWSYCFIVKKIPSSVFFTLLYPKKEYNLFEKCHKNLVEKWWWLEYVCLFCATHIIKWAISHSSWGWF